ncbi:MAG: sigma 54-interacting transcriptional regulator [Clostridiales Family XIII bacterium]|jgi:transcriptional regulator with PAS, ATPase and Fis domain|nr:sigma 54-interacting transcriptional regulator [Clostridiales Family XIII bacterium]
MATETENRRVDDVRANVDAAAIKDAWLKFVDCGIAPADRVIRKEIFDSWKRSKKYGLDPRNIRLVVLSQEELFRKQAANRELIDATTPLFQSLSNAGKTPFLRLDLYDADLYFIETYGIITKTVEDRKQYAKPGVYKSETVCGTTAMSIAKEKLAPVQLAGAEHFDRSSHDFTCTCVPIFSPENKLLGVINLVDILEKAVFASEHILSIMVAFGKGVEYNLMQMRNRKELELSFNLTRTIIEEIDESIFVADTGGNIRMMNRTAGKMLEADRANVSKYNIRDFSGSLNAFQQVVQQGMPLINRELSLGQSDRKKRYIGSIKPILSSGGVVQEVICIFRENQPVNRVSHGGGWEATFFFSDIIGNSPLLMQAIEMAARTSDLPNNTLIQGESGTGKEMFAQAIHNAGRNRNGKFVAVNCAAIPSSLIEAEFFGYESGAFTDAKKTGQMGKFELANGGTIFLDEINSLPLDMQVKLLRVVQEKTVTRIGGIESISLDLKIIAACNEDLRTLVHKNLFRTDLFFRLNVITINIPPLRVRKEDIPMLAETILRRKSEEGLPLISLSEKATDVLKDYPWPGNVRELENILERAYVQAIILKMPEINEHTLSTIPELNPAATHTEENAPLYTESGLFGRVTPLLKQGDRETILAAFANNRWNISRTAKTLGIARNTLYKKMKEYAITIPD